MIHRERLVQYKHASMTSDVIEALRQLEVVAAKRNFLVEFQGRSRDNMSWDDLRVDSGPSGQPPVSSMASTGREVSLSLRFIEDPLDDLDTLELREIAALWAMAVPLGFTPWDRNPVVGPTKGLFHYLGPWDLLYDNLLSVGMGEFAWASVCCAAQCDVGNWGGAQPVERFVQAQLHRLGMNPGPVDGNVDKPTLDTMQALGLEGLDFVDVAKALIQREPSKEVKSERQTGHVILPVDHFSIFPTGGIKAIKNSTGATLTIDGPGRFTVVVDGHLQ